MGRWTWRHDCIVSYMVNSIDTEKYTVYSDIPGYTAPGGGSVPPDICVAVHKPDIVPVEKSKKTLHLFELICPLEDYINKRHMENHNKYAHFVTDLSSEQMKCNLTCFEISSRGIITPTES